LERGCIGSRIFVNQPISSATDNIPNVAIIFTDMLGADMQPKNKPGVIGAAQVAIHILYAIFGEHRNITLFDDR